MAEINSKNSCNCGKRSMVLTIVMCIVAIVLSGCFVWQTICFHKTHIPKSIRVSIVDAKGKRKKLSDEAEKNIKEQLFIAFMAMAEKAESNYNDKFMALLTILSIFGIVWPIVIAYLQKMNMEEDRARITEALERYVSISDDLQKQKKDNLETLKQIEKMSESFQKQESTIRNLQRDSYMQYGVFGISYVKDSGLLVDKKCEERDSKESNPLNRKPQYITKIFGIMLDVVDAFCKAELVVPSKTAYNGDSLNGMKTISRRIYNLAWNCRKIIYNDDLAAELDKCIVSAGKIDQKLEEASQALQYLKDTKVLLEEDKAEQEDKNESPSNCD